MNLSFFPSKLKFNLDNVYVWVRFDVGWGASDRNYSSENETMEKVLQVKE